MLIVRPPDSGSNSRAWTNSSWKSGPGGQGDVGDLRGQGLRDRAGRTGDEKEPGAGQRGVADEGDLVGRARPAEARGPRRSRCRASCRRPRRRGPGRGRRPSSRNSRSISWTPAPDRGHGQLDVPDVLLGQGQPVGQPDALLRPGDAAVTAEEAAGQGRRPGCRRGRSRRRPGAAGRRPCRHLKPLSHSARWMAPGTASMPQLMFMPSKAGPAAVDVVTNSPPFLRTISPFVPRSMNSPAPGSAGEFRGHEPGRDVPADEALDVGRDVDPGLGMEGEADLGGGQRRQGREDGVERGQGQRVDGDAAEDVVHGRVAGDDRVVDPVAGDAAPPGHRPDHVVDELDGGAFQAPEVVGVLEGEGDPRDDVGAVGVLGVDRGGPLDDLPGPQVDELGRRPCSCPGRRPGRRPRSRCRPARCRGSPGRRR